MSFPGGAHDGFPEQQPQQAPGYGPPAGRGTRFTMARYLHLGTAVLGLVNLLVAFADLGNFGDTGESDEGAQFYDFQVGQGWIPVLLFVAGLLSLAFLLPGEAKKPGLLPPALSLATTLGFLFGVFTTSTAFDMDTGGIMVMIFAIIQTVVAVVAYLFDANIVPAPQANPYGQQQFGGRPPGGFQQQPQQQQGQYGQQPPVQPGQQTAYPPQQPGQFGQQPPGTPPGDVTGPG